MTKKEFVKEYGTTTATVLRLRDQYYGTGCIVATDSWFGSLKSAIALMKKELYGNMLVKTPHKDFRRDQLNEKNFSSAEWVACHATMDDVGLLVIIALRPESI